MVGVTIQSLALHAVREIGLASQPGADPKPF